MAWRRLSAEDVYRACDPNAFDFETTEHLPPPEGFIGQKRAVSAIHFGLRMRSHGYNLFLTGPPGTGKTSLIRAMLEDMARDRPVPDDICLVQNFRDPDRPRALSLPAGMGRQLKRDMEGLVEQLKREIPRALESKEYQEQQAGIMREYQRQSAALFEELERRASREGIQLRVTPAGIMTVLIHDGKPLTQEEYEALDEATKEQVRRKMEQFNEQIAELLDPEPEGRVDTRPPVWWHDRAVASGRFVGDQPAVGGRDLGEAGGRLRIVGPAVRMVAQGQPAVGPPDLGQRGPRRQAQQVQGLGLGERCRHRPCSSVHEDTRKGAESPGSARCLPGFDGIGIILLRLRIEILDILPPARCLVAGLAQAWI